MSTFGERIGSPRIHPRTGESVNFSTMSRSNRVQHHIYIERARREDRKPVRLKTMASTAGLNRSRCPGCRIRPSFIRARTHVVRLRQCGCQRLFNQHVEPRIEQGRRNRMMMHSRNCNRRCVNFEVRFEQLIHSQEHWDRIGLRRLHLARAAFGSMAATRATPSPASSSSRYTRRWLLPNAPAPATATRIGNPAIFLLPLPSTALQAAAVELEQLGYVLSQASVPRLR